MKPTHIEQDRDLVFLYALHALPSGEIPAAEAHIRDCPECQAELETLRPLVASFVSWPVDVLRPSKSLWDRLEKRISQEAGKQPVWHCVDLPVKPEWEEAAPGISFKLLSTDSGNKRVAMLVRLAPGMDYPPHRHAGVEELHLLDGELIVDDKKFQPGDYICAEADSIDHRVWSETGCTCVLLTSTEDKIL